MYSDKLTQSIARAANQVMDEQLKGDQHKIDKNKNNKIDAHDFKLLRSKNKVEESEQIDEISKATAKSYTIKKMDAFYANKNKSSDSIKKDLKGLGDAHARLTGAKPTSEEVGLEEGKMGQLSADLTDLSHADFHKEYGKPKSHFDPTNFKKPVQPGKEMDRAKALAQRGMASMKKEEVEELEEMFPGTPEYEKKYGKAPQDMKKGEKKKTSQGEMEKTGKGVVHRRKFSEMLEVYGDDGIKGLFEALQDKKELIEEPTNAEFTAELEKAKNKAAGKDKADVAAAAVKGTKEIDEEVDKDTYEAQNLYDKSHNDATKKGHDEKEAHEYASGVMKKKYPNHSASAGEGQVYRKTNEEVKLEERELTDAEMKEREKNVKGMKKGMEGFKERYGKDAKSVMYATATRIAKDKA
jgi:hypothetical protein